MDCHNSSQTENYPDDAKIKEICQNLLYQQRNDIISNLRTFARHDSEVQYFLNKIVDLLKERLENEQEKSLTFVKEKINGLKERSSSQINQALEKIDDHLNTRVAQIVKSPPYDEISTSFLNSLRTRWEQEYQTKYRREIAELNSNVNDIFALIFGMIAIFIAGGGYWYFLHQ